MTPLTHHDIVRLAAPFTGLGLRVDLKTTVRAERRIRFVATDVSVDAHDPGEVHHELTAGEHGEVSIRRAVWHPAGLASVVHASGRDSATLALALDAIPLHDQLFPMGQALCGRSLRLWLVADGGEEHYRSRIELTHLTARVQHLVLSVDVTSGGGMPADATLAAVGSAVNGPQASSRSQRANGTGYGKRYGQSDQPRRTLASGDWFPAFDPLLRGCVLSTRATDALPPLPDDLLAILGTQWRPLRPRGDHYRTVLRELGRTSRRADRADAFFEAAVTHLLDVLEAGPEAYHRRFHRQRRGVFLRRLRPVFLLAGMFALMPVMYLAVNRFGMVLHPLMLGLTPLLMVAAVVLSVREIPVMEWPAWPARLAADAFASATGDIERSSADRHLSLRSDL